MRTSSSCGIWLVGFELRQILDENFGALDIGIVEIEGAVVGIGDRSQNGIANAFDLLAIGSGSLAIVGEIAVIAHGDAGFVGVGPEVARGRTVGDFLTFVIVSRPCAGRRSCWARA